MDGAAAPPRRPARPERVFLALAAPLGLALAFALPPMAAPDEARHLARIWTLLDGAWFPPAHPDPAAPRVPRSFAELDIAVNGRGVPAQVTPRSVGDAFALARMPLAPGRTTPLPAVVSYPPLAYAPALVAVAAGRALGAGPGALVWLGRLANLAAWLALVSVALRLSPRARWLLVLCAALPTTLATAAAVSADPMTSGAAFLFVALVARAALAPGVAARSRRERTALVAAALLLGGTKPGYALLALAVLAIPAERCGGRGPRLALAAGVLAAAALPGALWLAALSASAPPAPGPGADPAAQLHLLASQPVVLAEVVARTLAADGGAWLRSFLGLLGPLTVPLPEAVYAALLAAFPLAWWADATPAPGPARPRLWLAAAFASGLLATIVMTYVAANPPGAPILRGYQGRYLAPAMPALVLALPLLRAPPRAAPRDLLLAVLLGAGFAALGAVAARYYAF